MGYWERVRDPALWRGAFAARVRWAALAIVTFPVGHWIFGTIFPRASVGSLIGALLFLAVALAWAIWETRQRKS